MMKYEWLDEYALGLMGAQKDFKEEWEAFRYTVGGRMFAMLGRDAAGREIVTVKLPPARGLALRGEYADIAPGYYMNKEHWSSVDLNGAVPDGLLKDMLRESYGIILASLPKKTQAAIMGRV
jgi:predicted DNA-binding protein (MmcQ/YjbR family)